MTTTNRIRWAISSACAFSACLAFPAAAQDQGASTADAPAIDEIIVTSRRVEESLQSVPVSVSAFRAEDLERLNIDNVGEASAFTPNFIANPGPTGQNDAFFFIRGVGQVDLNAATDPGVGTYIDGVYLGRLVGASLDSLDIERIEVLRGPQGTLFGRNTIGGAVNVVTASPRTDGVRGRLTVSGGERSLLGVRGSLNVPLGETAAFLVSGLYREQEGFGESIFNGNTFEDVENSVGRFKFLWEPSESFSAQLGADATRVRGTAQHQILVGTNFVGAGGAPLGSPLGVPLPQGFTTDVVAPGADIFQNRSSTVDPTSDVDVDGVNLSLEWDLGAVSLRSISAYRQLEQFATNDFDGTRFNFYQSAFTTDQDQFSQELQLTGDTEKLDWLLGAYWYEESAFHNNFISLGGNNGCLPVPPQFIPPAGPTFFAYPSCFVTGAQYITPFVDRTINNNQQFDLDIEARALFAHATWRFTDQWSASAGLRWTDEEKTQTYDFFIDNTDAVANFAGLPPIVLPTLSARNPFLPPTVPTTYNDSWSEVTPKVGVEFAPTDKLLAYLSYAEGFKSGGFNGRPTPNSQGQFTAVRAYDPERIETVELGFKSQLADDRVRFNAAAFFSRYEDIQLLVLGPSGFFETENAAESEIQGIELELLARPVEAFELNASVGYMDNEYTELDPGTIASGITANDKLPLTPEWNGALGAQYTWPVGASAFTLRGDLTYRSEVFFGAPNEPLEREDDVTLLNARATWSFADERFNVAAFVTNLTDEEYFTNGQDVRGVLGVAFVSVGAPRTWGAELTYRFGP